MSKVYSLRELTTEIYGTEEGDNSFESNYKELQRLDKALRKNSDYSNVKGILEENKDKYVDFIKDILKEGLGNSLIKCNNGKNVSNKDLEKINSIYLKHNNPLKAKLEAYNYMTKKIVDIQSKSISILDSIRGYFTEELIFKEKEIFDNTLDEINKLTEEYNQRVNQVYENAKKTCESYDDMDNFLYTQKVIKTLFNSIDSNKFNTQYKTEINKYYNDNKE